MTHLDYELRPGWALLGQDRPPVGQEWIDHGVRPLAVLAEADPCIVCGAPDAACTHEGGKGMAESTGRRPGRPRKAPQSSEDVETQTPEVEAKEDGAADDGEVEDAAAVEDGGEVDAAPEPKGRPRLDYSQAPAGVKLQAGDSRKRIPVRRIQDMSDRFRVREDVWLAFMPYNSKRPAFTLLYREGQQVPASALDGVIE